MSRFNENNNRNNRKNKEIRDDSHEVEQPTSIYH